MPEFKSAAAPIIREAPAARAGAGNAQPSAATQVPAAVTRAGLQTASAPARAGGVQAQMLGSQLWKPLIIPVLVLGSFLDSYSPVWGQEGF